MKPLATAGLARRKEVRRARRASRHDTARSIAISRLRRLERCRKPQEMQDSGDLLSRRDTVVGTSDNFNVVCAEPFVSCKATTDSWLRSLVTWTSWLPFDGGYGKRLQSSNVNYTPSPDGSSRLKFLLTGKTSDCRIRAALHRLVTLAHRINTATLRKRSQNYKNRLTRRVGTPFSGEEIRSGLSPNPLTSLSHETSLQVLDLVIVLQVSYPQTFRSADRSERRRW